MASPEAGQEVLRGQVDVDVAAGGDEGAVVGDHERAVELGELLHRLPEVRALDVEELRRVPEERVKEERAGVTEDCLGVADDEEGSDLSTLTALARDLGGEEDDVLERLRPLRRAVRPAANRAEDRVERRRTIFGWLPGHDSMVAAARCAADLRQIGNAPANRRRDGRPPL